MNNAKKDIKKIFKDVHSLSSLDFKHFSDLERKISFEIRQKHPPKATSLLKYLKILLKIKYRFFLERHLKVLEIQSDKSYEKYINYHLKRMSNVSKPLLAKKSRNKSYIINDSTFCVMINFYGESYYIYAHRNIWSSRLQSEVVEVSLSTKFEQTLFKARRKLSNQLSLI